MRLWAKAMRWLYRVWRDTVKRTALLAGVVAVGCILLMQSPPHFTKASQPQRFPASPMLEVQFIESVEDLRLTLGEYPSLDRETMRQKLDIDFVFIPAYVSLCIALGFLLARGGGWQRRVGILAAMTALGAGVFDMFANLAILRILNVPIPATSSEMLESIRQPSLVKWSLAAVTLLLLLTNFIPKPKTS